MLNKNYVDVQFEPYYNIDKEGGISNMVYTAKPNDVAHIVSEQGFKIMSTPISVEEKERRKKLADRLSKSYNHVSNYGKKNK